jgi:beta-glucanase (GH16 family)
MRRFLFASPRSMTVMLLVACFAARVSADVPGSDWTLVFADEFDGPDGGQPDRAKWIYEEGRLRNEELQYYTGSTQNVFYRDGKLVLRGSADPMVLPTGTIAPVTSGSLYTRQGFIYGRFEARLKIPTGRGVWPAFWLLGEEYYTKGWPWCGEVDIMENVGYMPNIAHAVLHYQAKNAMRSNQPEATRTIPTMATEFHVYTAVWTPEGISLYTDGEQTLSVPNDNKCRDESWPYYKPFNVKINLAIGGSWGGKEGIDGAIFPADYEIDYVRVYQRTQPPMAIPACNVQRHYAVLTAEDGMLSVANVAASIMTSPANVISLSDLAVKAIATVLDLADPTETVYLDALAPFRNAAGKTQLLVNFTLLSVDAGSATAKFGDTTRWSAFDTMKAFLRDNVFSSTATSLRWALTSLGGDCADCFTPAQGPIAMPYDTFKVPATVPFSSYDFGGLSVGYWDHTSWNQYGKNVGRNGAEGVDLTQLSGTVHTSVGYAEKGEWFTYSAIQAPDCTDAMRSRSGNATVVATISAGNGLGRAGIVQLDFIPLRADGDEAACGASSLCNRARLAALPTNDWSRMAESPPFKLDLTCGTRYRVRATFPVDGYLLDTFSVKLPA